MARVSAILSCSFLLLAATVASATVIHVPAAQSTIREGLAIAAPGDTVEVACGSYLEHGLTLRSGVVLRSETGRADCVTIDGEGLDRIAYGASLSNGTVLEGITFRRGFEPNGRDFGRNFAPETGPRFSALSPGERDLGGGGAIFLLASQLTIRHCAFEDNEATIHGGAVRAQAGQIAFEDVTFESNVAGNQGGAVYAGTGAVVTWLRCSFRDNRAKQGGSGYLSHASITGSETRFESSQAEGSGGALQIVYGAAAFDGCVFYANEAARGGAVAAFGTDEPVAFQSCTLALNRAPVGGATSGAVAFVRCILAFHVGGPPVDCTLGEVSIECSDVFGNSAGNFVDCLADDAGVNGNFSEDPRFCTVSGDLQLVTTSPCLPESTPCGLLVGALGAGCDPGAGVVVTTDPTGLLVELDGVTTPTPIALAWVAGTSHTIGVDPLQANESSRHTFEGWSDGGAATHEIVVPAGPIVYSADYSSEHYLIVASTSGGTTTPGSGWHAAGDSVTVQGFPNSGWILTVWEGSGSGSYSGQDNPTTVVMLGPVSEFARFAFDGDYNLLMTSNEGGTISPMSGPVHAGTIVQIVATPNLYYDFLGWQGEGQGSYTGPNATASVLMEANITQHAVFRRRVHRVTMIASGPGVVAPGTGDQGEGTVIEIQATPTPGYALREWVGTGDGSYSGTALAAQITVNGPITQRAYFEGPANYPLSVSQDVGGTTAPPSGSYPNGAAITIQAAPDAEHVFDGWVGTGLGSYTGPNATAIIHIWSTIVQHADFRVAADFTLTMTGDVGGTISPPSATYQEGSVVEISATANPTFRFVGWTGTGPGSYTGPDPLASVTMRGNIVQSADFAPQVALTVTTDPPGKNLLVDGVAYVSPAAFFWAAGTIHALSVDSLDVGAPGERDRFIAWNDSPTTVARTITAQPGTQYVANYAPEVELSFPSSFGGTVLPGSGWHPPGTVLRIDALPDRNFRFLDWSGGGDGSYTGPDNPTEITMSGPVVQEAQFDPFDLELSISTSGEDPHQNVAAPAGGPRTLFLWATCADEGLAALQARVTLTGALTLFGFFPMPSVLNLGSSTDLLLALGGCDVIPFPRVLGTWAVLDQGGSMCLGADAGGIYTAVGCGPVWPGQVDFPRGVGFTSSGAQPCTAGTGGCTDSSVVVRNDGGSPPVGENARVEAASTVPLADVLNDASPNPFSKSSSLHFSLRHDAFVRLDVHDVAGRLVRRLVQRQFPAGAHVSNWDGRDDSGYAVPSGIYFVRLATSGGFATTGKIVRLRD